MDKELKYKKAVRNFILEESKHKLNLPEVRTVPVIDDAGGHYLLYHSGWHNNRRVYSCYLHIDVEGDRAIVQHNGTDIEVADELMELGVCREDIVLEFLPPYSRQYSGFAVA
ncbi:MAG: XisI protein [Bacteroidota bacterium]